MIQLYFGDVITRLTTCLILAILTWIALVIHKRNSIRRWGWLMFSFILAGTLVSALSATRDAFMTESALFLPSGMQAAVCSAAGALIFLTGIVFLFVKKTRFRRLGFFWMAALFVLQVAVVEISRISLL